MSNTPVNSARMSQNGSYHSSPASQRGHSRVNFQEPPEEVQQYSRGAPVFDIHGREMPAEYTSLRPFDSYLNYGLQEGEQINEKPQCAVDRLAYSYTNAHKHRMKESQEQIASIKEKHKKIIPRKPRKTSPVSGTQRVSPASADTGSASSPRPASRRYAEVHSSGYGIGGEYSPSEYQPRSARRAFNKDHPVSPKKAEDKARVRGVVSQLDDKTLKTLAQSLYNALAKRKEGNDNTGGNKATVSFETEEDRMKAELVSTIDQLLEARKSVNVYGESVTATNQRINSLLDKFAERLLETAESRVGARERTAPEQKQALKESIHKRLDETLEQSVQSRRASEGDTHVAGETPTTKTSPNSPSQEVTERTSALEHYESNINKKLEDIDRMIQSVHKTTIEDLYWNARNSAERDAVASHGAAANMNTSQQSHGSEMTNGGAQFDHLPSYDSVAPQRTADSRPASSEKSTRERLDLDAVAKRLYESLGSEVEGEIQKMRRELGR
eukprot:gb/GECG01006806.1/.p1 GENE.gb/GECG01006806.1/~~gb/GECG01006806.1/.p1  ORF type:complete len:499 (+),score=74.53 gb/GECG01006806.1/:1-1497(+)